MSLLSPQPLPPEHSPWVVWQCFVTELPTSVVWLPCGTAISYAWQREISVTFCLYFPFPLSSFPKPHFSQTRVRPAPWETSLSRTFPTRCPTQFWRLLIFDSNLFWDETRISLSYVDPRFKISYICVDGCGNRSWNWKESLRGEGGLWRDSEKAVELMWYKSRGGAVGDREEKRRKGQEGQWETRMYENAMMGRPARCVSG